MNRYSQDLRDIAITLYQTSNYSKKDLAALLSLGYSTLCRWCKRCDDTGNCLILKPLKEGRHSLFNDKQAILNYFKLSQFPDEAHSYQ